MNESECIDVGPKAYRCKCSGGTIGKHCETAVDWCMSDPCQNGSTCEVEEEALVCICLPNSAGPYCQFDDLCRYGHNCGHGGTCKMKSEYEMYCLCAEGWTGLQCEKEIDECLSDPCTGVSYCVDDFLSYECFCKPGWEGDDCDKDIDDCVNCIRENTAKCVDYRV